MLQLVIADETGAAAMAENYKAEIDLEAIAIATRRPRATPAATHFPAAPAQTLGVDKLPTNQGYL